MEKLNDLIYKLHDNNASIYFVGVFKEKLLDNIFRDNVTNDNT